jgi:hypothetical protein
MAAKAITAFSFTAPAATGIISGTNIAVTVPIATDVTALVATFTTTGASVAVSGVAQTTAVTANDFTSAVTYTVTATDATTQDYTVTVTVSEVTAAQIAQLRRLIAEPTTTTYSDALLIDAIMLYPHMDEYGETQYDDDGYINADWTPTYDLNAAAADVWNEKASAVAHRVDFSADGGKYSMSNQFEQYMKQARYFRSRRMPSTARMVKSPQEWDSQSDDSWIGNLPEGE